MNHIKFNKFERIAGLFVGATILGFVLSLVGVAVKQGWFDSKIYWTTSFASGDGIHPGTTVQIQGLKAGSVDQVELTSDNRVSVTFYVLSKFEGKVKVDSVAQLIRPFVIGDRILDISVGAPESEPLAEHAMMSSEESVDLLTIMGGRDLGNYLKTMSGMMDNLKVLAEAFLDKNRTQAFINAFDRIDPLLKNLNAMSVEVIKLSKQASKDENLGVVLKELAVTTRELNHIIPEINRQAPDMAKDMTKLVGNLALLTEEFKVVIPALAEIAPDLPQSSRRALEALDEAVVLIKAMEKSFLVKGNAEGVREEEAKRDKNRKRMPSQDK
jgi:phospholipid/cholesterol/gamma-HCH transport system substrate-binding protein